MARPSGSGGAAGAKAGPVGRGVEAKAGPVGRAGAVEAKAGPVGRAGAVEAKAGPASRAKGGSGGGAKAGSGGGAGRDDATRLGDADYATLLAFRVELRRFLQWSGAEAAAVGLTPTQHQLLLAIRGHPDKTGPTITDVAGYLLIRHHSAVELVDRAEGAGLVVRRPDAQDLRMVRLVLTSAGADKLARLSVLHVEELRRLAPWLEALAALGAGPQR